MHAKSVSYANHNKSPDRDQAFNLTKYSSHLDDWPLDGGLMLTCLRSLMYTI